MIFVFHTVQVLQICAHLACGLSDLRHLHMLELVEAKHSLSHFIVEQGIPAFPLKFRQDTHAIP